MNSQDVQVKEVDSIRVYNQKFGEFLESFNEHLYQLQQAVHKKLDELTQIKQDIKIEREKLDEEIHQAKRVLDDSYNYGSYETCYRADGSSYTEFIPDYNYISQCQDNLDHLIGPVYHNVQICEGLANNRLMQATQISNMIEQRTNSFNSSFQNYVRRGQQYLEKVILYIDQYKDNNLK